MQNPGSVSIPEIRRHKSEINKNISPSKSSSDASEVPDYVRVIVITDMNGRKRKLYIPAALDLDRPKRPRTTFSAQQLQILEMEFQENHFVAETRRLALSRILGLSETQIKVWFQNRRTKQRRDSSDDTAGMFSKPFPWTLNVSEKQA